MSKLLNRLNFFFKIIFGLLTLVSKIILELIIGFLRPISKVLGFGVRKLRLSIAFKLNCFYGLCYILFFIITYSTTLFLYLSYLQSDISSKNDLFSSLAIILGVVMAVSFVIFLIIGRFVTRKFLSPLNTMNSTIKAVNGNELGERLDLSGTQDELKDLAYTFNSMMDRLEIFIDKQKQFVSDASHELRTPIAVIEGYANLLSRWGKDDPKVLEESILAITQETSNMQQLVEKLLFLARSDKNTQDAEMSLINLSTLALEVLKETSFIDDTHELKSSIGDDVMIDGDKNLIKELIRIFIDNALKYTNENGSIEILVTCSGKNSILAIRDTGIGIPAEHLPHIFERFYRIDEARAKQSGGSGLGLSIAKWIIDIHHGKVYVNSVPHKGTEFVVFFDKAV